MMARTCAIVVAGGVGRRFGRADGKQLVNVAGRPLMTWSLAAFDACEPVQHIVVVAPADRADEMRVRAVDPFGFETPVTFAAAGATRQDSTRAGLAAVPAGMDVVAVHDCARPLVRTATIEAALLALDADPQLDGVVCGQPAIDTLKQVGGGAGAGAGGAAGGGAGDAAARGMALIETTPDRSRYWTVQTPQVFRTAALRRAFELADAEGFVGTDDASLVERAGGRVACLESPRDNLKVTVPEDLPLVEALLRAR